jgi:hypothetical protein
MVRPDPEVVEDGSESKLLELDVVVSHDREAQIPTRYTWFRYAMRSCPNCDA